MVTERLERSGQPPAARRGPAAHGPADLVHQPDAGDGADLDQPHADGVAHVRRLDLPAVSAQRARAWPRWTSSAATSASSRCRSSRTACRPTACRWTRCWPPRGRPPACAARVTWTPPTSASSFSTTGQALTPQQLGEVVLVPHAGLSVRLKDVAEVREAPAPKFGDAQINGRSGVVLLAYAQYQANTMVVTRALEAALQQMKPALAAEHIDLDARLFRPANFIETSLRNVDHSLLIGGVLVARGAVSLPARSAHGVHFVCLHSAVAPGGGDRAELAGRVHQHHHARRVCHRHRRGGG